jgi:tRNA threonylcarbamoyladenosine modification (KEOPS) complex  Pcc1 subunit
MMDYKADIVVKEDADKIHKCLLNERISRERSSLNITRTSGGLSIKIEAKDAAALRASVNAVTQVLAVYSKMKNISKV